VLGLPRLILEDGQRCDLGIVDDPQNLPAKAGLDEKVPIGAFLHVRVKRLGANRVRLFCSFQKNDVEKSRGREVHVLGSNAHAVQDVELRKPVKMVLQKDANGTAQRWVEITVDEQMTHAPEVPPPARAPAAERLTTDKPPERIEPAPEFHNDVEKTLYGLLQKDRCIKQ